jgi:hypothetical protein
MSDDEVTIALVRQATRNSQPETGETMGIVQCRTFRCLAIRGRDGKWRNSRRRILDVVEVISEF